jgi:2-iminobutanoate/2-iminopropanoate deaminase
LLVLSLMVMTILDNPAGVPAPPSGRFSHVAVVDLGDRKLLVLSGQVAVDASGTLVGDGDISAQTAFIMETIRVILAAHGATFGHIINIRTYLTDLSQVGEYAEARRACFSGPMPTSTTVAVSGLFVPGALLEVEVTAVI